MTKPTTFPRPWCCPDSSCQPFHIHGELSSKDYERRHAGDSFICFGELDKVKTKVVDGVQHDNDLSVCSYVAGGGLTRWLENEEDWGFIIDGYSWALRKLKNARKEREEKR